MNSTLNLILALISSTTVLISTPLTSAFPNQIKAQTLVIKKLQSEQRKLIEDNTYNIKYLKNKNNVVKMSLAECNTIKNNCDKNNTSFNLTESEMIGLMMYRKDVEMSNRNKK